MKSLPGGIDIGSEQHHVLIMNEEDKIGVKATLFIYQYLFYLFYLLIEECIFTLSFLYPPHSLGNRGFTYLAKKIFMSTEKCSCDPFCSVLMEVTHKNNIINWTKEIFSYTLRFLCMKINKIIFLTELRPLYP
ncbi:MAG: hypothetical protein DDT22_01051 [candidate division WS2 bacterium]|nr:hypothetical protein [Candidatus Lithacetigena glycinireducens]